MWVPKIKCSRVEIRMNSSTISRKCGHFCFWWCASTSDWTIDLPVCSCHGHAAGNFKFFEMRRQNTTSCSVSVKPEFMFMKLDTTAEFSNELVRKYGLITREQYNPDDPALCTPVSIYVNFTDELKKPKAEIAKTFQLYSKKWTCPILKTGEAKVIFDKFLRSTSVISPEFELGVNVRKLYQQGVMTDFVIVSSDEKELKVHRIILAAASEVFLHMFSHKTQENINGVCRITDTDFATLTVLVDWLYGLPLDKDQLRQVCLKLYIAADKYQLLELKATCAEGFENTLSLENAVDYFKLAKDYEAPEMLEKVVRFICGCHDAFLDAGGLVDVADKMPQYSKDFFKLVVAGMKQIEEDNKSPPKKKRRSTMF